MTDPAKSGWKLPPGWLWLIALPFLVFVVTNVIAVRWGQPSFHLARPWIPDGHAEAAGRIRTEGAFLLYCAFGLAALFYSGRALRPLAGNIKGALLGAWAGAMVAGISVVFLLNITGADTYLEGDFPCASLDLLHQQEQKSKQLAGFPRQYLTPPALRAKDSPPPRQSGEALRCRQATPQQEREAGLLEQGWTLFDVPTARYPDDPYRIMRILYALAALLLFLAMPAVIWGAAACLALPETGSAAEKSAAWTAQTTRLNRLLYITAGFLVAGLLFSSARFTWSAYSLHPADLGPFKDHIGSVIFYMGVSNSIMIASYYLPAAARLAASRPKAGAPAGKPKGADSPAEAKAPDPYAGLKTTLTILSPALVGLIGELVKFSG